MSQWPLNFDRRIDYGRYDEITVEIALTSGDSLAAVDATGRTPWKLHRAFSCPPNAMHVRA
jgi:hypothetical protein